MPEPAPAPLGVRLTLRPHGLAVGGDAVARDVDGRVVFVAGALPEELVVAEVVEERRDFARAVTVEVREPAPSRRRPPCPHVERGCGGCGWQHVDEAAQRRWKVEMVADALRRIGRLREPEVSQGPPLPVAGHRTTVRLARDGVGLGFRRSRSHDVVEVGSCLVAHPLLEELLGELDPGAADELTLRCGARTGDRLVLAAPTAEGVRAPEGVVVVGLDELRAGRRAWIHEEAAGRRWRVSARSFFQAGPTGAEALVDVVAKAVEGAPPGRLVDAYGGVGLFAGTVGAERPVTLLERNASAVADARTNLSGQQARVLRLDVDRWRPSHASVVVADPARTGLGRAAVGALTATGAARLVLVSCDAAALGRDAGLLDAAGYRHAGTVVVDLFPQTPHVETVSTFVPG